MPQKPAAEASKIRNPMGEAGVPKMLKPLGWRQVARQVPHRVPQIWKRFLCNQVLTGMPLQLLDDQVSLPAEQSPSNPHKCCSTLIEGILHMPKEASFTRGITVISCSCSTNISHQSKNKKSWWRFLHFDCHGLQDFFGSIVLVAVF